MIHIEYTEEFMAETCAARILHTKRNRKGTKLRAIYRPKGGRYTATMFTARAAEVTMKPVASGKTFQAVVHKLMHKKNWKDLVLD